MPHSFPTRRSSDLREGLAWEPTRQFLPEHPDVFGGRPMAFPQLDLNITVLRPDGPGIVVGHIDAADRHADIVDQRRDFFWRDQLSNCHLYIGEYAGSLQIGRAHV